MDDRAMPHRAWWMRVYYASLFGQFDVWFRRRTGIYFTSMLAYIIVLVNAIRYGLPCLCGVDPRDLHGTSKTIVSSEPRVANSMAVLNSDEREAMTPGHGCGVLFSSCLLVLVFHLLRE